MESKNLVNFLLSVSPKQTVKFADLLQLLRHIGSNPQGSHALRSLGALDNALDLKLRTKHHRGGRHKKWDKPSAEKLRQDFTDAAQQKVNLNATQIVDKMKTSHPEYASITSSTIVRWLGEFGISIKEVKRSVRASIVK